MLSRRVDNTPAAIGELIEQITGAIEPGETMQIGIDMLGGIARLLELMLTTAGLEVVHVPRLAVKTARHTTHGGEHKSDPRDARVIADQVRARDDLRRVHPRSDAEADLALPVSRRQELVVGQTRRIGHLHDLYCSIAPGLERVVDLTHKIDLALLARCVTPAEIRHAGKTRFAHYLRRTGRHNRGVLVHLVDAVVTAAQQQRLSVPGEGTAATIIKDLAVEGLAARDKIAAIDARLAEVLASHPHRHPARMRAVLTTEFLAMAGGIARFPLGNHLAAAAGVAPALNQSGKVRHLQRPLAGDRALNRVFYQLAFCALERDRTSRTFYHRKRREGKTHHQALIALARRRVNVIYARLRDRQPHTAQPVKAA